MVDVSDALQAGGRVAVIQQIPHRDNGWTSRVEGEIVRIERKKTGSWFAHSRDDKLWLDRLVLRKDDGEIVVVNLDRYSHIEWVQVPESAEPESAESEATEPTAAEPSDTESSVAETAQA